MDLKVSNQTFAKHQETSPLIQREVVTDYWPQVAYIWRNRWKFDLEKEVKTWV